MGKTVTFYTTADGKCPIQGFLDSLPGKVVQKVTWVLRLIEDLDSAFELFQEARRDGRDMGQKRFFR